MPKHSAKIRFHMFEPPRFVELVFAFFDRDPNARSVDWIHGPGAFGGCIIGLKTICGNDVYVKVLNPRRLDEESVIKEILEFRELEMRRPTEFYFVCGAEITATVRAAINTSAREVGFCSTKIWSGKEFDNDATRRMPEVMDEFARGVNLREFGRDDRIGLRHKIPDRAWKYDIILRHSRADAARLRGIARRFVKEGLHVWFVEWELRTDDISHAKITEALKLSRVLLLFLSRNLDQSEWLLLEGDTFPFRDPANSDRRFIPVRVDKVDLPASLTQFAHLDWNLKTEAEFKRLLVASKQSSRVEGGLQDADTSLVGRENMTGTHGHILCVGLTRDGRRAVTGSKDRNVRVWDVKTQQCLKVLAGHIAPIIGVAISANGRIAVSGGHDCVLRIWDLDAGLQLGQLGGHGAAITAVALDPAGRIAVSASAEGTLRLWDIGQMICVESWDTREVAKITVTSLAISHDLMTIVSGDTDNALRLWSRNSNGRRGLSIGTHTGEVLSVAISSDGRLAVSGSVDTTVRVWDLRQAKGVATLEGHTGNVWSVAMTDDGRLIASGSEDGTIRLWVAGSGICASKLAIDDGAVWAIAMTAEGDQLVSVSRGADFQLWNLPPTILKRASAADSTRYTNAKVLLVGDSGAGKTGLAYRLAQNRFRPAIASTDAAWATQLKLPDTHSAKSVEREIWLWDFAGQSDYRLIHQLYMDETALAVLVFNPQSENPFDGLGQWDRELRRAARRPFKRILVAGRIDRGGIIVSREAIERFREEAGFAAYLETSAKQGTGCPELREAIAREICWRDIPWTTSPGIFRLLKSEIVKLKDEGRVLLRVIELRQQLEMRLPASKPFTIEQLRAVIGLLAGPGVVWALQFGDFVLLQPERINYYAAAVIRTVRAHTEEIGCILEEDVLTGKLDFQDMVRLPLAEEQIVLRAMHQLFIAHSLCLREHTEKGTFLIFPSYFKRERPSIEAHPHILVTYKFKGALDEIYATLVVRLHHTTQFEQDRLWRFACDFKTQKGSRVGLKLTKHDEGQGELEVFFSEGIPEDVQVSFIRYVHEHLLAKAENVVRLRHFICACGKRVEDRAGIEDRLRAGKSDIVCVRCEKRVKLHDLIEEKFDSDESRKRVRELETEAMAAIDNQSRELILIGHTFVTVGEAGQIYRPIANADHGIDGEIEFKDNLGRATGQRLYLQLKSGDSYLTQRRTDGTEVFRIRNPRHATYWKQQAYPVMLVVRKSDGSIRWMDVSAYLNRDTEGAAEPKTEIIFHGEPFTTTGVLRYRERLLHKTV